MLAPDITDEHTSTEAPTTQIVLHSLDCCDICRVAREHPRPHRQPVASDRQADHDLWRVIASVLRVATLALSWVGTLTACPFEAAFVEGAALQPPQDTLDMPVASFIKRLVGQFNGHELISERCSTNAPACMGSVRGLRS